VHSVSQLPKTSSRMRKKTASGVPCLRRSASRRQVASLRGSTYGLGTRLFIQAMGGQVKIIYDCLFARCGLAGRPFAHPAWLFSVVSTLDIRDGYRGQHEFFRSLLEGSQWRSLPDCATSLLTLLPHRLQLHTISPHELDGRSLFPKTPAASCTIAIRRVGYQ